MKNKTLLYYFWSGAIVLSLVLVLFALCFASLAKGAPDSSQSGSQVLESAPPASDLPQNSPDVTDPAATAPVDPAVTRAPNGLSSPAKLPETEDMGQDYLNKFSFLGDSTTYGLDAYGCVEAKKIWTSSTKTYTLPNWSYTNIYDSETGTEMSLPDMAAAKKPEFLMITLGVNGVAFLDETTFKDTYTAMVQAIQAASPDTVIILNSIFPVAASYGQNSGINNNSINTANGWILNIAEDLGLRYLDTNAYLKGADGFLPEDYQSGDGLHLNPAAYEIILNCIRTHGYSE